LKDAVINRSNRVADSNLNDIATVRRDALSHCCLIVVVFGPIGDKPEGLKFCLFLLPVNPHK